MLRAASKTLLRAHAGTTTVTCNAMRYASIPWHRGSIIRPCSSSSPFMAISMGSQQEGKKLVEQHSTPCSNHDGTFHQTADPGGFSSFLGNDALDHSLKGLRETGVTQGAAQEMAESSQLHAEVVEVLAEGASVERVAQEMADSVSSVFKLSLMEGGSKTGVDDDGANVAVEAEGLELLPEGDTEAQGEFAFDFNVYHGEKSVEAKHAKASVEADENKVVGRASRKRVDVPIDPILMQPKALSMLKKLGLLKFVRTRIPGVNKQLCNEFLASSLHKLRNGYGMVHGRMVMITPEAVHRVTGLPMGAKPMQRRKTQGKFVAELGTRVYKNGFDLKTVKLSENEEENRVLVALVDLLTKKIGLFHLGDGRVAGPVVWGVYESWHANTQVQWAAYMSELMRKKAERLTTVKRSPKYGGWLTAVIKDAGSDDDFCKDEDELLKITLEQLDQKKQMLEAKEKEIENLKQKVLKLRKLIVRCSRLAKSVTNNI